MFILPSLDQIKNIFKNLLQVEIPELNPNLRQSWISYLAKSNSLVASQYIDLLKTAYQDNFIITASREALIKKGEELGIPQPQPQKATGIIIASASAPLQIIPANTEFIINDNIYTSSSASVSLNRNNTVFSNPIYDSTRNETNIITSGMHNLVKDISVEINSAIFAVKNISGRFEFQIEGDQTSTISFGADVKSTTFEISVISQKTGENQNVSSGSIVQANINSNVIRVSYEGINGGADEIQTEAYRNILLSSKSLKGGCLTPFEIKSLLLNNGLGYIKSNIPFSVELGDPDVGETKIYVLRSNDQATSSFEKNRIKSLILDNIYPVNSSPDNLFVVDATKIPVDFQISNLKMNTSNGVDPASESLRSAVIDSLQSFFLNEVEIGKTVERNKYINAVERAIDEFGNTVASSEINNPSNEITVQPNQKAVLGSVSFV